MTTEQIIIHIESEIVNASEIRNVYPEKSLTGFAEACYNMNSENELAESIIFWDQNEIADTCDMKEWGISPHEWREAIESALAEKIRDRV
jgi:hypothetical protein